MFPAPFYIALLFAGFSPSNLSAGIEELTLLISPDGKKHVVLAGDIHRKNPKTQPQRLTSALTLCQKRDPSPFEIYLEKPEPFLIEKDVIPELTLSLERTLAKAKVPGVSIEDCEVRTVSGLALWIFSKKYPNLLDPKVAFTNSGKCYIAGEVTFHDLNAEFNTLSQMLRTFSNQLSEDIQGTFGSRLDKAQLKMEHFNRTITPFITESNTIISTALSIAKFTNEDPNGIFKKNLINAIFHPFADLFNLNLIMKILDSANKKLLILSGVLHTRAVKEFLTQSKWTPDSRSTQKSKDSEKIDFAFIEKINSAIEE